MENKKVAIGVAVVVGIAVISALIAGLSYSFYLVNPKQQTTNSAYSGCLSIEGNIENIFNLDNAYPMSFNDAKRMYDPTVVTVSNTCEANGDATLKLYLETPSTNTLDASNLAVSVSDSNYINLRNVTPSTDVALYENGNRYLIYSGNFDMSDTKIFDVRMWLDEAVTESLDRDLVFNSKLRVEVSPR